MKHENLTLIGTSHIAKSSVKEIKEAFEETNPDIVALELDKHRLYNLTHPNQKKSRFRFSNIFRVGIKGYIFSIVGEWVQKTLGRQVGIKPGADMLTALKLAKKEKKQIALIDQDITITLKRLSKAFSWKEKWQICVDFVKGIITRKSEIEFDLSTVPDKKTIRMLMTKVKEKYPSIYKVLIEERNQIMANRLAVLMKNYPDKKILAVVGAGHEEDMMAILKVKLNQPSYKQSHTIESIPTEISYNTL